MEHESDHYTNAFDTVTNGLLKRPEDLKVGGRVETIQYKTLLRTASILKKSWRLAVIQTLVKDYQLTLIIIRRRKKESH